MKKFKFIIPFLLVIVMLFAINGMALAADPVVSIDVVSPGGGDLDITTTGIDSSAWHPGEVGEVNTFSAEGQFTVSYDSYSGSFGKLSTFVNAASVTGGAFLMTDTQNFDILSANHNYGTTGVFTALAESSDSVAGMNLKSIGSMYVWSEASNGGVGLSGQYIAKQYNMTTNNVLTSTMTISAITDGLASIWNSAAWGFGANENGTITTNYSGGTRSLTATGTGMYQQYVSSSTSLVSNVNMNVDGTPVSITATQPGGSMSIIANFLNNFAANPYTVTAK